MARGLTQRPAATGNPRPGFALPLTGGTKGGVTPLMMEECEEEDEPAAAAPQQAPVLAVAAPSLAPSATSQASLPNPAPKEEAAVVAPPMPEWELAPSDKTLNAALKRWAAKAGWQLVWEFPHDYEIDVRSTIPGTFEEAIDAVARNISTAETPMRAIFYKGNKVLRIVAKGRE
ncbi:MAG TPA: toxin co-regulated pilus biosynthesis Q family protein [Noviherbaspirillum sp.]|nr:toxin co-regulated pilus biosynthesis Q family protein [Noviherbaspirillum sp.]